MDSPLPFCFPMNQQRDHGQGYRINGPWISQICQLRREKKTRANPPEVSIKIKTSRRSCGVEQNGPTTLHVQNIAGHEATNLSIIYLADLSEETWRFRVEFALTGVKRFFFWFSHWVTREVTRNTRRLAAAGLEKNFSRSVVVVANRIWQLNVSDGDTNWMSRAAQKGCLLSDASAHTTKLGRVT